jgi:hypothetical protein
MSFLNTNAKPKGKAIASVPFWQGIFIGVAAAAL